MSDLKVSSLVKFPEKKFTEIKNVMQSLHQVNIKYVKADSLYDLDGLERLKREATGHLELLANHYATTKKFKTMGDYLEETRKQVKAEAINLLVEQEQISINQAEKTVYSFEYYKERVELMETLKAFFIRIEVMYNLYQTMLHNIVQSISLCKKDPNYKPNEE